jgi:hypothetical protein
MARMAIALVVVIASMKLEFPRLSVEEAGSLLWGILLSSSDPSLSGAGLARGPIVPLPDHGVDEKRS